MFRFWQNSDVETRNATIVLGVMAGLAVLSFVMAGVVGA